MINRESVLDSLFAEIESCLPTEIYGRVEAVKGLLIEVAGPVYAMSVGARLLIEIGENAASIQAEVVGFRDGRALCMPFGELDGVRHGSKAKLISRESIVHPSSGWLGRVVNALGEPIDGKGPLPFGSIPRKLRDSPPPAAERARVGGPIDLGVRSLNSFVTCCQGQRLGIFAGSGVGKSVLMSMLARNAETEVSVIGLIGERGREVQEFIEDDLGEEGLAKSVVVVATSDESVLMRREAAYLTLTLSEYFRDEGKNVLCMMDSVTRFAMAQREIGLSVGEPPTSKGYTPTVFTELPKLLERAGPGAVGKGSVTALFTVLVEGDNHNEPVADAVRGILDGHIVMERQIAERGRYPAINVLKSVSRTMPRCVPEEALPILRRAKQLMSAYADMEELIRLGAYKEGADPLVDEAIAKYDALEAYLGQMKGEKTTIEEGYFQLAHLLEMTQA